GVVARLGRPRLRQGGWVHDVRFSPDARRIAAVGSDNAVRVWDGDTGKALFVVRRPEGGFERVAFSPDGKVVLAAGHGKGACDLRRIDAASGDVTARLPLKAPRLARSALQFNRDGSRLALGTPDTRELRVLDTATGATAWAVKLGKETPGGTAFAADGGT